ncbi:MAG: glycosyltransferase family 1 protein [Planctomycetota bacterium]|nr:MAG: glycosyltransferase family 1 protein [Planctomycetota bacterium]
MKLLMVSGDRQVVIGEKGPFHSMQREFSRYFERIDVICPRADGPITTRVIHGNVHFHPAPCGRVGMVNYIEGCGTHLIRQHGHRLVTSHDYGWFYNGFGSARIARATGVPYLSELHHIPGIPVAVNLRDRFDRYVARKYVGWARSRAIAFRVVNKEELPSLLHSWGVPLARILVLPSLYIDQDVFHERQEVSGEPREPGEPEQDLLFVGRMVNNKGVDRIIDAMAILARRGMRLTALFVGKGPLRPALMRRSVKRGLADVVRFVEWVDSPADLAQLYRASRVCVCASTCEGGPRFTVEAMACGTPVVSTAVGVMGDLLGDGRAGGLAGFDAKGLADGLERVLADEAGLAAKGRHAAELARNFEYARALGVYANGLRRLAGETELTL